MSSGKARAKFFAKLALWLPFAGLVVYLAYAVIAGSHGGAEPRSVGWAIMTISCWYIWTGGIALGLVALHRTKTEGRKGAFGRSIAGIVVSSLFLGLTVWGAIWIVWSDADLARREKAAKREAEMPSAGVSDKAALQLELVAKANQAYLASLRELTNNYFSSHAALTNPPVIDMTGVRSRDDLVAREQKIRDFIKAAEDVRDFCKTATNHYRQELSNQELSDEVREGAMKGFVESQHGLNGLIVTYREADVRRGYKLLDVVAFLDTNWGKWTLNSQTRRLLFRDARLAGDYNRALKEWKDADAEAVRLQQQYVAAVKEKKPGLVQ